MKTVVFKYIQPAMLAAVLLYWAYAPAAWVEEEWTLTAASLVTLLIVQLLEFVNERHAGWRLNRLELLTDVFYVTLSNTAIAYAVKTLTDDPMVSTKHALGITTEWAMHLPFVAQVALTVFLVEFGQYWMHRLMHNSFVWWTHAPHHHITQLNAAKGAVGNPIELFLVSLSVVALFDLSKAATFCAFNILTLVSSFAHANVRCNPPRWYSFFFTTIEHHSLHHSVPYNDTRCNYANSLILCDRMLGTFREGEAEVVGQEDRRRLSIVEQFLFPFRPLLAALKARPGKSASATG